MGASILITVAVSDPGGGLKELAGAIKASVDFADWGQKHGYRILAFRDKDENFKTQVLTIDHLRERITAEFDAVQREAPIDRVVIHFVGHGFLIQPEKRYWLLNGWKENPGAAIDVSALRRRLRFHEIGQVSLIADSCSEISGQFIDVEGSGILHRPDAREIDPESDQFFASSPGWQAFMVNASEKSPATCIFSNIVISALKGEAAEAFDNVANSPVTVTSQSLARFIKKALPHAASRAGVEMLPSLMPAFFTNRVYSEFALDDIIRRNAKTLAVPGSDLASNSGLPISSLGSDAIAMAEKFVQAEEVNIEHIAEKISNNWIWFKRNTLNVISISQNYQNIVTDFKLTGSIFTASEELLVFDYIVREGPWREISLEAIEALIPLEAGLYHYASIFPSMKTLISRMQGGQTWVNQAHSYTDFGFEWSRILALLVADRLSISDVVEASAIVRVGKHMEPVRGCVAAYLYDAIGDVPNIRRMAAYYALHSQPVPFDVAVLAEVQFRRAADGGLIVDIPAVEEAQPRNDAERARLFTTSATPPCEGLRVSGSLPLMSAGFAAISKLECSEELQTWKAAAIELRRHLGDGVFTKIRSEGVKFAQTMMREAQAQSGQD